MKTIHVIDLDSILHIGSKSGHGSKFNIHSIPTGGIFHLLNVLKKTRVFEDPTNNKLIFTRDFRENFRREIFPEYKGNRNQTETYKILSKGVRLQKEIIEKVLVDCGFLVFNNPEYAGYESDDVAFNIALHYACNYFEELMNGGLTLEFYTSDEDWVGILGLAPRFYLSYAVNGHTLSDVRTAEDYYSVKGHRVQEIYWRKAVEGDKSDNYPGFGSVIRQHGINSYDIITLPEIQNYYWQKYWDSSFWLQTIYKYYGYHEVYKEIETQINLAYPIYMPQIFQMPLNQMLNIQINWAPLKRLTNDLRIKTLEKYLGPLEPYNPEALKFYISMYGGEYKDVLEYFKQIQYSPQQVISAEGVDKAFNRI